MNRLEGMCVLALLVYGMLFDCDYTEHRVYVVEEFDDHEHEDRWYVLFRCRCGRTPFGMRYP